MIEVLEITSKEMQRVKINPRHIVCIEPVKRPPLIEGVASLFDPAVEFSMITLSTGSSTRKIVVAASVDLIEAKINNARRRLLKG